MCEEILLSSGLVEEAYARYGLVASRGGTYLATFRAVAKKYPQKTAGEVLAHLVKTTPGDEGKWFSAAKEAGLYDEALALAGRTPCDPKTLTRAARDFAERQPAFAMGAGLLALHWLVQGYGYEITSVAEIRGRIQKLVAGERAGGFVAKILWKGTWTVRERALVHPELRRYREAGGDRRCFVRLPRKRRRLGVGLWRQWRGIRSRVVVTGRLPRLLLISGTAFDGCPTERERCSSSRGRFRDSDLRTGGSPMKRLMRIVCAALPAFGVVLFTAANLWAVPFSRTSIIIEVNATAGDGGIQISLDATGWNRLEISDPYGQDVLEVGGTGSVGTTGITELFFESAEPSFEDLPLHQLLARFPEGRYSFEGVTVDGKPLTSRATLSHSIPAAPTVFSPVEGSTVSPSFPVIVDWDPVFGSYPGTSGPITISGYQVIVERVKPQPLLIFSVFLPAEVTQVTVPAEFIQANADYKFEVLAIEESGNQTITESSFSTSR